MLREAVVEKGRMRIDRGRRRFMPNKEKAEVAPSQRSSSTSQLTIPFPLLDHLPSIDLSTGSYWTLHSERHVQRGLPSLRLPIHRQGSSSTPGSQRSGRESSRPPQEVFLWTEFGLASWCASSSRRPSFLSPSFAVGSCGLFGIRSAQAVKMQIL
jgi:hypothetical protein